MIAQSKIKILCGKGGVGKTTLSLALALKYANAGLRVVVVSSHPLPELALSVSLEGLAAKYPVAAKNLFLVHLDAKELLTEVVEQHFPMPLVARTILNSSIFQNLIEVAPGLKEFYFLARFQQLAERKRPAQAGNSPDYDVLIWDAPATGHFLSTLQAARSFETYLTGPLASAGAELARFFSNAAKIEILGVTPLEEMAMAETLDLSLSLRRDFQLSCAMLLLNLVSPLVTATEAEVQALSAIQESSAAFRFARERGLTERQRSSELKAAIDAPQLCIPRIRHADNDLDLLTQVGAHLQMAPA